MSLLILVDTGPIVAAINRRDQHHQWAYEQFERLPLPFLTCEAVLTEAAYLLARSGIPIETMLDLLIVGAIRLAFDVEVEAAALKKMLKRYRNVPMDLADACMVRMAELHPSASVLTLDSDFYIYRMSNKKPLSVITTL
jgi:predicted nucleic acid-binding protein